MQRELLLGWTLTLMAPHRDLGELLLLWPSVFSSADIGSPACFSVKPQIGPAWTKGSGGFQALCGEFTARAHAGLHTVGPHEMSKKYLSPEAPVI